MTSDAETMERINILFVSATTPYPAIDGGRLRVLNLVSRLCQTHSVTFLTFIASQSDERGAERLREMGMEVIGVEMRDSGFQYRMWRILRSLFQSFVHGKPLTVAKYHSGEMAKTLRDLLRTGNFDVAHFEMLHTGQFLSDLGIEGENACITVLGEQNIDSDVWRRLAKAESSLSKKLAFYWQCRKFRGYESWICRRFDMCICVSAQDREKLERLCPGIAIEVVPNGVDLDYFKPGETEQDKASLVFTGSMDWHPNEDAVLYFCNHIFPLIRAELPETAFYIVGGSPSERVLDLQKLDGVIVTGLVEDVRPYIANASVYVVPLRVGGGTRLKILQALAMKKAVVSTSIGAEGLGLQPDVHILVADEPQDFAASAIRLIRDAELRNRLSKDGNALVREEYDWDVVAGTLELAYRRLISNLS